MKKLAFIFLLYGGPAVSQAQVSYDSITISRFLINDDLLGKNWTDTLKAERYTNYLTEEKTVYRRPTQPPPRAMGVMHPVLALTDRIKKNGTADVAKCFIPRHSINYYKQGKIVTFLQVCFECDGLRFSDDPGNTFIKSVPTREKQMAELKALFKQIAKASIYDSVTISRIVERDTLDPSWHISLGYHNELDSERNIWNKGSKEVIGKTHILSVTDSIEENGTGNLSRCFDPHHRVNYYKAGMIKRHLQVCFDCDELRFSDDRKGQLFVRDRATRDRQMSWLRVIFNDLLGDDD